MLRHTPALIVSLVCAAAGAACGGSDSDVARDTIVAEPSLANPLATTETTASSTAAQLVDESTHALERGDWENAADLATKAIELGPGNEILAMAYVNRAVAYGSVGRTDLAVTDATSAIELEPPAELAAVALVLRANAHLGMRNFDGAVVDASAAIDREPEDTDMLAWAYSTRGGAYNEMDRREEAVADTSMAIDLDPEDDTILAQALLNRSAAYRALGRLDDALDDVSTAIALEPGDMIANLYFFRALTYLEMGRFDDVVANATAVIELGPPPGVLAQMYVLRAGAFAELGRMDDAASDLELATSASPYAEPDAKQVRDKYGIAGPAPIDHQTELATGETPLLAQQLVDVDGYTYAELPADELAGDLDYVDSYEEETGVDLFVGTSWHPVVADDPSQNTASNIEVGFLFLLQHNVSVEDGEILEHLRRFWIEGERVEEFDIAGVTALLFENPAKLNSRYTYTWTIDGVSGVFDGADREPLERWLTAYLEQLTQDER